MLKNYFKHIMFKDYLIVLSILAMTLLWDFMGYDMTVAHWFGINTGFALQNNYLLKFVFHEMGQNTARLLFIVLIIMIWRPLGIFKSIHKINRIQMVFSVLLTSTSITLIKHFSQTSCPWSLSEFGGVVPYISHWQWNINTPQSGHCFPGGHASSGFAFIAASFWFRDYSLRLSKWVWWLSSLIGLIFGWTQQMRGAHFFSHTLWSWVICASVGLIYFYTIKKAKYQMNHLTTSKLYIGVMTGTSLDGLDAVLADFSVSNRPHILAHTSIDYPLDLRLEMLALQASSDGTGINELHRSRIAAIALSDLHTQALQQLLCKASINSQQIAAIGVHGQTVRHLPQGVCDKHSTAYTIQLLEPTRIAEALQCVVVSDFRARDIAAGGQGAPLVPAFHAALSADITKPIAFVNIGGFANVTLLNPLKNSLKSSLDTIETQGFDTGPGNVLMDSWIQKHLNQVYDANGVWAASGQINQGLLLCLQSHPYFLQPTPKSTGREAFNINWLESILNRDEYLRQKISPADVQATLCELTAISIAQSINQYLPQCNKLLVCGGGAYNHYLMQRLSVSVTCDVVTTETIDIAPQQMEALAFAWLARQCMLGSPANLPTVTGAAGLRVLGSICPA